jgi:N-acetylglucosaminyldiphosphoundecaprenol N-acetyl-beta-D-mannosaminyltransferase
LWNGTEITAVEREEQRLTLEYKKNGLPVVNVGGLPTVAVSRKIFSDAMVIDCLKARHDRSWTPKLAFSSNGQGIALAGEDPTFEQAMLAADYVHADGMSVVIASKLTATPLPERIATTDFFHDAAKAAQRNDLSFFILGSTEEQNAAAVDAISRLYPGLRIAGRHHGYFGKKEEEEICELIRSSGTDVLWVALGKPQQEYWCLRNRERLSGVGWIKTCGGLYAFLSGDAPRAPQWMQDLGLEWLFRLIDNPRHLFFRYLITNPRALYRLLRHTQWSPKSVLKSAAKGENE